MNCAVFRTTVARATAGSVSATSRRNCFQKSCGRTRYGRNPRPHRMVASAARSGAWMKAAMNSALAARSDRARIGIVTQNWRSPTRTSSWTSSAIRTAHAKGSSKFSHPSAEPGVESERQRSSHVNQPSRRAVMAISLQSRRTSFLNTCTIMALTSTDPFARASRGR